jgi:hypothetical protein
MKLLFYVRGIWRGLSLNALQFSIPAVCSCSCLLMHVAVDMAVVRTDGWVKHSQTLVEMECFVEFSYKTASFRRSLL